MKTKEINWPTPQWIATWLAKHPGKDATAADCAWWDAQIDKGNPTPYDLTEEQQKQVKAMRKNAKSENSVNAYGKTVKRERKPNETKREIIAAVAAAVDGCVIVNPERQIDFTIDGKEYSLTLTEHRKKKE